MISIQGITKIFHTGAEALTALRRVSLDVPEGQMVLVIGSNGSGKSTLLNTIAGVFPCEEGQIFLDGVDISPLPEHRRASFISRVFQNPRDGTAGELTIEENLAIAFDRGKQRGLNMATTPKRRSLFQAWLARLGVGLEHRLDTRTEFLSGGQRQMLTLSMAMISKPRLLLLDEHTAALDPVSAKEVLSLTENLVSGSGVTTLMVTHNMADALRMGHRTIMMHRGEVVLDLQGEERYHIGVQDLIDRFYEVRGERLESDELLLQVGR